MLVRVNAQVSLSKTFAEVLQQEFNTPVVDDCIQISEENSYIFEVILTEWILNKRSAQQGGYHNGYKSNYSGKYNSSYRGNNQRNQGKNGYGQSGGYNQNGNYHKGYNGSQNRGRWDDRYPRDGRGSRDGRDSRDYRDTRIGRSAQGSRSQQNSWDNRYSGRDNRDNRFEGYREGYREDYRGYERDPQYQRDLRQPFRPYSQSGNNEGFDVSMTQAPSMSQCNQQTPSAQERFDDSLRDLRAFHDNEGNSFSHDDSTNSVNDLDLGMPTDIPHTRDSEMFSQKFQTGFHVNESGNPASPKESDNVAALSSVTDSENDTTGKETSSEDKAKRRDKLSRVFRK